MAGLFTNRATKRDFVLNALTEFGRNCDIQIASAFFSDEEMVKQFVEQGCTVDLVVRLGSGTNPTALQGCLDISGVNVRYYTHPSYHPKFYIFGGQRALLGSANLTASGLGRPASQVNQEATIAIEADDPTFDDLRAYFEELWEHAEVFDQEKAVRYQKAAAKLWDLRPAENEVTREFGNHRFPNIEQTRPRPAKAELYATGYRKRFQKALAAIHEVTDTYGAIGDRLEPRVPLEIEVDQFFNFIRERRAEGETYKLAPILSAAADRKKQIRAVAEEYRRGWAHLREIAIDRYPRIVATLGTREAIDSANQVQLWDALLVVNAFNARSRYFDGGQPAMRAAFFGDNDLGAIRESLAFLTWGRGAPIDRLTQSIFGRHKLKHFGEHCCQELLGWIRPAEVPICNGRSLIALRWLGYDLPV